MFGSLRPITDRAAGIARRSGRTLDRLGRRVGSNARGTVERVRHRNPEPKDLDDVTLARKVETEIFRPAGAPKGKVTVDAADGVVTLRGEVRTPAQVKSLEKAAAAVPEVRRVENLLKLPKTPARSRADAPGSSKRTGGRKKTGTATTQRAGSGRFNTEREPADAEPTPKELAGKGEGRKAAPLGAKEPPSAS